MTQITQGAAMIADERARQIDAEGFHQARDVALYNDGELVKAAVCYASVPVVRAEGITEAELVQEVPEGLWPWDAVWWKPGTDIQCLVKAGALIAAEIDRRLANDVQPEAVRG